MITDIESGDHRKRKGISADICKIFVTEHYFRHLTCLSTLRRIDIAKITLKSVTDNEVLSNYQSLISDAELIPDSHVCKDVLQAIVTLYVRVRSFSFAKDKIQHYKMKQKQTKGKALRKELLRSCGEHEQDRYDGRNTELLFINEYLTKVGIKKVINYTASLYRQ